MKRLLAVMFLAVVVAAVYLTNQLTDERPPPTDAEIGIQPVVAAPKPPEPASADVPWQTVNARKNELSVNHNLFHPERAFIKESDRPVEQAPDANPEPEETGDEQHELVAIGRLGPRACAIIIVTPAADDPRSRRSSRANPRPTARLVRPTRRAGDDNQQEEPDKPTGPTKKVYLEKEPVGDSGWLLETIESNSVTLTRDGEEKTLHLDLGDEDSRERREAAHADARKKLESAQAAAAQSQDSAEKAKDGERDDRELSLAERRRRILEARRAALERRRKALEERTRSSDGEQAARTVHPATAGSASGGSSNSAIRRRSSGGFGSRSRRNDDNGSSGGGTPGTVSPSPPPPPTP